MAADCAACKGACCKCISLPLNAATLTADRLLWFEGRGVVQSENWIVKARCRHLTPENLCAIYETRPNACRVFVVNGTDCKQAQDFENVTTKSEA